MEREEMEVENPLAHCKHPEVLRYVVAGVEEWRCIDCATPFTQSSKLGDAERLVAEQQRTMDLTQGERQKDWDAIKALECRLGRIRALVDEQAEDDGLWAVPIPPQSQPISEAYLQSELRRLHAEIESVVERQEIKS